MPGRELRAEAPCAYGDGFVLEVHRDDDGLVVLEIYGKSPSRSQGVFLSREVQESIGNLLLKMAQEEIASGDEVVFSDKE